MMKREIEELLKECPYLVGVRNGHAIFEEKDVQYTLGYDPLDKVYPFKVNTPNIEIEEHPIWFKELFKEQYRIHYKDREMKILLNESKRISLRTMMYICIVCYGDGALLRELVYSSNFGRILYVPDSNILFAEKYREMVERERYTCNLTPIGDEIKIEVR